MNGVGARGRLSQELRAVRQGSGAQLKVHKVHMQQHVLEVKTMRHAALA